MDGVQCWHTHIVLLARACSSIVPPQLELEHHTQRVNRIIFYHVFFGYIYLALGHLSRRQLPPPLTHSLLFFEAMSLPQAISELWEPTFPITITRDDMRDIRAEASRCWLSHQIQVVKGNQTVSWNSQGYNFHALHLLIDTNSSCGRYCECRDTASVSSP